jgi:LAO/AO transport system kinase
VTAPATRSSDDPEVVAAGVRRGDRASTARMLTLVESADKAARPAIAALVADGGHAYTIGMTGAPGAGKSSLTDRILGLIRAGGERVAVLAVDPSSPRTGGAILGDRVRMGAHATDPGVFIRSMATRGQLGGLAAAVPQAIQVLDAGGFPWIVVETVGVGQVELDVAGAADTTVVVVNPGWGDGVQANKAGILEIADVFAVNKADRDGADAAVRDLVAMLELSHHSDWVPPIVETVATTGAGVEELWDAVGFHRRHLEETGQLEVRRRERLQDEIRAMVRARLLAIGKASGHGPRFESIVDQHARGAFDAHEAVERIVAGALAERDR